MEFLNLFVSLVKALGASIAVLTGFLLLGNKLSIYLVKDEIQRKLKDISKAQNRVKAAVPLASEEIEQALPYSPKQPSQVDSKSLDRVREIFEDIFSDAFHASSNVSTYTRLAELLFSNLFHIASEIEQGNSHTFSGSLGQKEFYNGVAFRALSLIEAAAVQTTLLPKVAGLKDLSFLPRAYSRFFLRTSAKRIRGLEQGVYIRGKSAFPAEFFYNVLGPAIQSGKHAAHRVYFSILRENDCLLPYLMEKNIHVPLILNLSNIERTRDEIDDPNVVDLFGDNILHLIGVTSVHHHGSEGTFEAYVLTYTCLKFNVSFLNAYKNKDIQSRFDGLIKGNSYYVSSQPNNMLLTIKVSKEAARFYPADFLSKLPVFNAIFKASIKKARF